MLAESLCANFPAVPKYAALSAGAATDLSHVLTVAGKNDEAKTVAQTDLHRFLNLKNLAVDVTNESEHAPRWRKHSSRSD